MVSKNISSGVKDDQVCTFPSPILAIELDAEVKVPGNFGGWDKRFRRKEYAIA